MAIENKLPVCMEEGMGQESDYLQKFRLYETQSKFYLVGTNKNKMVWRVLKIDRLDPTELNICEDATMYSQSECHDLLKCIHEGNGATGGLKFVTACYGIVGFIKFLGPYYMLLVTKRRQIGTISGHAIYAVTKSKMIPIPSSSVQSNVTNSKNEIRYKRLLCTVDLTKDFFFSYSYHVMRSLQKNLCDDETGQVLYDTMFVWNEFLTRGIRNHLKNTIWTIALVHGFFKQAKLSVSGRIFKLTLIARRSRHYAGTRYLKRGVNEKGRVANDVETEQIVSEDAPEWWPAQISSIVQNRGSIPLFWSQETSCLNIRPDINLNKKDMTYEATRLHFENLVKRYGNPIIILNLIKTREKKPRESKLRAEFFNAINFINRNMSEDNRLKFLHWDLNKYTRSHGTNVLVLLDKVATYALNLTGIFYCRVNPLLKFDGALKSKFLMRGEAESCSENNSSNHTKDTDITGSVCHQDHEGVHIMEKQPTFQKGVLRTNCIDCLDRTNVAQYAYGLAALGQQLHALGIIDDTKIDLDGPLADDLMSFYENMGDTLALQYGGSPAHNKIFSERRGQWRAATESQEFFRTLQRYYSNVYIDAEKQDAINLFLGYFQPQEGKPALWELDSDQHYNIGRPSNSFWEQNAWSVFKRSLSDGNILCGSNTPLSNGNIGKGKLSNSAVPHVGVAGNALVDSTPEITTSESDVSYSRYSPSMTRRQLFSDRCLETEHIYFNKHDIADDANCSNFLDLDWLSSSGNSCEEEAYGSSSPAGGLSSDNVVNGINLETPSPSKNGSCKKGRKQWETELSYREHDSDIPGEFSAKFMHWVDYGQIL